MDAAVTIFRLNVSFQCLFRMIYDGLLTTKQRCRRYTMNLKRPKLFSRIIRHELSLLLEKPVLKENAFFFSKKERVLEERVLMFRKRTRSE